MLQYVILFDGVCNLCNGFVQFIIKQDKKDKFNFAPLKSKYAQNVLNFHNLSHSQLQSIILIVDQKIYIKSNAALQIAKQLGGLWYVFSFLKIIPLQFRDLIYDFVAKNRYKWFGKKHNCMLPFVQHQGKFLE